MIGMVNVQCDSPMDFYASPVRAPSKPQHTDGEQPPKSPVQRTLSYRPLFFRKNVEKIAYAPDGRKMSNGEVIEKMSPNKLWEELIVRSFAHKIEEEVKSPVEGMKRIEQGIHELKALDGSSRGQSSSTYSLVSDHRVAIVSAAEMDIDGEMEMQKTSTEEKPGSSMQRRRSSSSSSSHDIGLPSIGRIASRRQGHKRTSGSR